MLVLVAAGVFALRPDDERLAPAPPAPTETEHPPGTPRDLVFDDAERYVAVPPGLYAVPFSGWGDVPPEVADLRAVVDFPAGLMNLHRSTFAEETDRAADPRELGFWTVHKVPFDFCIGPRAHRRPSTRIPVPRWRTWRPPWPPSRGSAARIPVPVTIGGYDGLYVELTKPPSGCRASTLWFAPRVRHVAYEEQFIRPGDVARIWIIDVDGKRVVIDTIHPPGASEEKVAQTHADG